LALILYPPQAWRILKPDAAAAPLGILDGDILRHKDDPVGRPMSRYSRDSGFGAIRLSVALPSGGATAIQRSPDGSSASKAKSNPS
jgi:hypothetical protein